MRKYSLFYFIGQGFRGLWVNGIMTAASVIVLLSCLIVMGSFALLVLNIDFNLGQLGDLNEIYAFVDTDDEYESGDTITLAAAPRPKGGEVFLGWSPSPDGYVTVVSDDGEPNSERRVLSPGSEYTVDMSAAPCGITTMYAIWDNTAVTDGYRIRYTDGGLAIEGAIPETLSGCLSGAEIMLPSALNARYSTITFLGWSTEAGADTPMYNADSYYYVLDSDARGGLITLHAVWSRPPVFTSCTLAYDSNGIELDGSLPTDNSVKLAEIMRHITALDNVSNTELDTKEEILAEEKEKLSDYPELFDILESGDNPYPDTFIISYTDNSKVTTLEYQLEKIEGIYKVRCRSDLASEIESLKNGIILIFVWFMAILSVVSVFIIINTIKLAVYSRRQEIAIMRFVGATNWFIGLPYVFEGVIIGLFSGGVAYFLQWYMYSYINRMALTEFQMISVIPFESVRWLVLAAFLGIGVLTGIIGSLISLGKYTKA